MRLGWHTYWLRIFKCNEIQSQKSINDMAVAFHGQPSNNIDNVFSTNSNYRVQYFNDACFLKVQKFQSVHNLFLIYFGSSSKVQAQKTTSGSFQVFENKESEWDAVKRTLLVPIRVLWIFRSVLIVSNSKQRRLASEMLQCRPSIRRAEGCARLRPNDATDSFNFSSFICCNSQLKNLLVGNWRRTLESWTKSFLIYTRVNNTRCVLWKAIEHSVHSSSLFETPECMAGNISQSVS